ncbi:MAG: Uma2 family endonuclease [Methylobacter sp.]|nr:MAG: Uma2 family endonuclease [Methylobacter sp.]
MQWAEVVDNPYFENLPFKIELNRYGKIEMTPASNKRGRLLSLIGTLLERKLKEGEVIIECSVQTTEDVKVADVAWCSKAFIKQYGYETPYTHAPEICIEVVSPSNSKEEMSNKVQLYFQAGAEEVWIVWKNGIIDYYNKIGKIENSSYGVNVKL